MIHRDLWKKKDKMKNIFLTDSDEIIEDFVKITNKSMTIHTIKLLKHKTRKDSFCEIFAKKQHLCTGRQDMGS